MTSPTDLAAALQPLYPALAQIPPAERDAVLATQARHADVPAGARLFDEGAPCQGFPLVLRGAVRVARGAANGRSLELYRVTPGELCVVSTSCLFGQQALTAHGETTEPTELVLLSPAGFERWSAHEPFRRFVFGIFADRLADLMALAEAVAFQRLDQRLATALLGHGATLRLTHQALADELGTAREIVTRLLKRFEQRGWVMLGRERIELRDAAALRAVAAGQVDA
ncbi:MAG: Crp/Fnr family transcriptional regulator [Burkholderiaceae bacterium]|nr:Crp/Fnr family transcriptional regulator [Burkholderiaceae bacterium]